MIFLEIWTYIGMALAVVMCGIVFWFLFNEGDDRAKEEAAREYFDAHGHWPDEA